MQLGLRPQSFVLGTLFVCTERWDRAMTTTGSAKDEFGRRAADVLPWRSVRNLADACELTALWLEGRSTYLPMYLDDKPADETAGTVTELAAINRLGFMTDCSQPGAAISSGGGQRAFVTGFCDEQVADRLLAGLAETDLVILTFAPGQVGEGSIPVSLDGEEPFTWLGRSNDFWEDAVVETFAEETNPAFAQVLKESGQVHIFDPIWGRNDVLLPAILRALT